MSQKSLLDFLSLEAFQVADTLGLFFQQKAERNIICGLSALKIFSVFFQIWAALGIFFPVVTVTLKLLFFIFVNDYIFMSLWDMFHEHFTFPSERVVAWFQQTVCGKPRYSEVDFSCVS